ncbi:hypothetical protein [Aureimonas pseudogalii]|uniref:Uncharacterized protein n=1 Tax=Aureimonas pseudogalii TaxID=1744844 RepID=A0A7W6H428_9HYPH|nr:hypothetical protein [Aureimonas pseudogalii]MBB3998375.1 hypothetical protein [Aureimonas pseudogalii]
MSQSFNRVTVPDAIRMLFPNGTNVPRRVEEADGGAEAAGGEAHAEPSDEGANAADNPGPAHSDSPAVHALSIDTVPDWPPDAFAAAAYLLDSSGIFQYVMPGRQAQWKLPFRTVSDATHKAWVAASAEWLYGKVPQVAQDLWDVLLAAKTWGLHYTPKRNQNPPDWLEAALGLLIMADEASAGAGYGAGRLTASGSENGLPLVANVMTSFEAFALESSEPPSADPQQTSTATPQQVTQHLLTNTLSTTITIMANPDLVAVQPKSRTPQVGSAFRTLSHNLAFLDPAAQIATSWRRMSGYSRNEVGAGLNLLLVPFPYEVEPEWFHAIREPVEPGGVPWGWFDLKQGWLPADPDVLADFVVALVRASHAPIHGVVFPEFSLRWEHHRTVIERLATTFPGIEFLVSGSFSNCEGDEGNFELTSSVYWEEAGTAIQSTSRPKHHRWRLDRSQIETYGLERQLDVDTLWWEGIQLERRQLHTNAFRQGSSFSVLICEDLARSDPCHGTLRSLGPNLVICLLMDTAQVPLRWPARYATGLAEDPGSSVLTFTSRALIERANKTIPKQQMAQGIEPWKPNWSVALWRDDSGPAREIHCAPGQHAVVLSLAGERVMEHTFDGRPNDDGFRWRFKNSFCIALPKDDAALVRLHAAPKIPLAPQEASAPPDDIPAGSGVPGASDPGE